jgi:hypothetical protein
MQAIDLPDDLLWLSLEYCDKIDVDVTEEINETFGPQLLEKLRIDLVSGSIEFFHFHKLYPMSFLRSFASKLAADVKDIKKIASDVKDTAEYEKKKLKIAYKADVTEQFVLQHGDIDTILCHPKVTEPQLLKVIEGPRYKPKDMTLTGRKDLSPYFLLDNMRKIGEQMIPCLIAQSSKLTEQLATDFLAIFRHQHLIIMRNTQLSLRYLIEKNILIDPSQIGARSDCRSILAEPGNLHRFLNDFRKPRADYLGPWFFQNCADEIKRIDRYFDMRRINVSLLPLFRQHRESITYWHVSGRWRGDCGRDAE